MKFLGGSVVSGGVSKKAGEKLRGGTHVSEDASVVLLQQLLPPDKWIYRPLPRDYGVDAELEWAPHDPATESPVTGQRIWVQLKSSRDPLSIRTQTHRIPRDEGGFLEIPEDYVSYTLGTDDLSYALRCGYPLLLFYADLTMGEIYWLPLREHVRFELSRSNPHWRDQDSVTVRLPTRTRLTLEALADYPALRWFAHEPQRLYAFAELDELVAVPLEEGSVIWGTSPWNEIHDETVWQMYDSIMELAEDTLRSAVALDPLFDERKGVPAFRGILPYPELHDAPALVESLERGLDQALRARRLIAERNKADLDHPQDLVEGALRAAAAASRIYRRLNKAFLVNEEAAFTRWAAEQDARFASVAAPHLRR